MMEKMQVAVVTGAHVHDVIGFDRMFRSIGDAECFIQHMEDWSASPKEVRESYDAVVFYNMHTKTPTGEEVWYEAGMKPAIEQLGETKQGIFVLHHSILAFREWDLWSDLVGITTPDRGFDNYHLDQTVTVEIANPNHPITQGMSSWQIVDETYTMANADEGNEILLTADHPKSLKTLGWTRQYKNSPVFCLALGHDNQAFANPNFREIVARGILWCAGRI